MGAKNGSERPFQGEFLERDLLGFDREIGRVNRHVLGAAVLMERRSLTKKMVFSLTVIPVWAPLPILYVLVQHEEGPMAMAARKTSYGMWVNRAKVRRSQLFTTYSPSEFPRCVARIFESCKRIWTY